MNNKYRNPFNVRNEHSYFNNVIDIDDVKPNINLLNQTEDSIDGVVYHEGESFVITEVKDESEQDSYHENNTDIDYYEDVGNSVPEQYSIPESTRGRNNEITFNNETQIKQEVIGKKFGVKQVLPITEDVKVGVISHWNAGKTYQEIADIFHLRYKTVVSIIKSYKKRGNFKSHKKVLSKEDEDFIIEKIKENPGYHTSRIRKMLLTYRKRIVTNRVIRKFIRKIPVFYLCRENSLMHAPQPSNRYEIVQNHTISNDIQIISDSEEEISHEVIQNGEDLTLIENEYNSPTPEMNEREISPSPPIETERDAVTPEINNRNTPSPVEVERHSTTPEIHEKERSPVAVEKTSTRVINYRERSSSIDIEYYSDSPDINSTEGLSSKSVDHNDNTPEINNRETLSPNDIDNAKYKGRRKILSDSEEELIVNQYKQNPGASADDVQLMIKEITKKHVSTATIKNVIRRSSIYEMVREHALKQKQLNPFDEEFIVKNFKENPMLQPLDIQKLLEEFSNKQLSIATIQNFIQNNSVITTIIQEYQENCTENGEDTNQQPKRRQKLLNSADEEYIVDKFRENPNIKALELQQLVEEHCHKNASVATIRNLMRMNKTIRQLRKENEKLMRIERQKRIAAMEVLESPDIKDFLLKKLEETPEIQISEIQKQLEESFKCETEVDIIQQFIDNNVKTEDDVKSEEHDPNFIKGRQKILNAYEEEFCFDKYQENFNCLQIQQMIQDNWEKIVSVATIKNIIKKRKQETKMVEDKEISIRINEEVMEMDENVRESIISLWKEGKSYQEMEELLNMNYAILLNVVKHYKSVNVSKNPLRPGRVNLLTTSEELFIIEQFKEDPTLAATEIMDLIKRTYRKKVSTVTIQKVIWKYSFIKIPTKPNFMLKNRKRGHDLSFDLKNKIIAFYKDGKPHADIARILRVKYNTVANIIRRFRVFGTVENRSRHGYKNPLDMSEQEFLINSFNENPDINVTELQKCLQDFCQKYVSTLTIQNIISNYMMNGNTIKVDPKIDPDVIQDHLANFQGKGSRLSLGMKNHILVLWKNGQTYREIERSMNLRYATVANVIKRYQRDGCVEDKERSGRRRILNADEEQFIVDAFNRDPRPTFNQIRRMVIEYTQKNVCTATIRSILYRNTDYRETLRFAKMNRLENQIRRRQHPRRRGIELTFELLNSIKSYLMEGKTYFQMSQLLNVNVHTLKRIVKLKIRTPENGFAKKIPKGRRVIFNANDEKFVLDSLKTNPQLKTKDLKKMLFEFCGKGVSLKTVRTLLIKSRGILRKSQRNERGERNERSMRFS